MSHTHNLAHSKIMEVLKVLWIVFHDVGGWLFEDHPDINSQPDKNVLDFVKCLVLLWGGDAQYVAANTQQRNNSMKDIALLDSKHVWDTGIPAGSFIECNGPEQKGPKIKKLIQEWEFGEEFHVEGVVFDNSWRVLISMPENVYCFGYRLKEELFPEISQWYKKREGRRLYQYDSIPEIANKVVYIHNMILWKLIRRSSPRKRHWLEELFQSELTRAEDIFHAYGINVSGVVNMFRKHQH